MIRHGQIEPEEPQDRADQTFGLAQRQPKHRPQGHGRPDRESRIMGLTTTCGAGSTCQATIASSENQTVRLPSDADWRRTPPNS